MAILTSALAALLILAGLGTLAVSVDLIPTEVGLLYGVSGVILVAAGAIVLAVAALIHRLDRIVAPKPAPPAIVEAAPPDIAEAAPAPPAAPEETTAHEVGRYVVGGIEYAIFSNGAIEAQTEEGPMRFASMAEFRAYLEAMDAEAEAN